MLVKIYLPSLSGCVWILKQGDPQQQLQFLPILAPFLSRAITADVFLQPTARSKGRIPLQSTCSTDAPWSTKYCTYNRNMEHRIKFPYYINQKEPNSSLLSTIELLSRANSYCVSQTTSGSPQKAARSRGVRPLRSAWVVAAPLSTSSLTSWSFPFRQAQLSAVSPSLSVWSREAPGERKEMFTSSFKVKSFNYDANRIITVVEIKLKIKQAPILRFSGKL